MGVQPPVYLLKEEAVGWPDDGDDVDDDEVVEFTIAHLVEK